MDWEKILKMLKNIIPQIKAQVAEKVQGAEKIEIQNLHFTINYNDTPIQPNFPPQADPNKIANLDLTPELEKAIQDNVSKYLKLNQDHIESLPEKERFQFITDVSSATLSTAADIDIHPIADLNINDSPLDVSDILDKYFSHKINIDKSKK